MSMTTFYTSAASSAAQLAEALLLTSSTSTTSTPSVSSDDMSMLDYDVDDSPLPSCLSGCVAFANVPPVDLVLNGDAQAVTSAVFCFVKNFVW